MRLLREMPWRTPNDLAEEMVASLSDETTPQEIPEGIILQKRADGVPPIQIHDFSGDGDFPVMRVTRGDESYDISFGPTGDLETGPEGETSPVGSGGGGSSAATGGNVFPGVVISHSGSNVYLMNVYFQGRTSAPTRVSVTQLEGDPNFPHEVGRWTFVLREPDGNYCMWIPVWATEVIP